MPSSVRQCPGCGRTAPPRRDDGTWPFCSDRCRLADLGRWLGEAYRIPGERAGDGGAVQTADEEEER
jgi:endogenous inhibitor of DNA gyrase (YacG/DUF329 family)